MPEGEGFEEVQPSEQSTVLPDAESVSADYAVELINNLSHLVDHMADMTEHLQRKLAQLENEKDT